LLDFDPGEAVQVDFGQGPKLPNPKNGELSGTWIFVMTLCFLRHQYAEIVFDQTIRTWCGLFRKAFEELGGVPRKVIIDNPKCAITRACYYDPDAQRSFRELAEGFGFQISACPPRDPKKRGASRRGSSTSKETSFPCGASEISPMPTDNSKCGFLKQPERASTE